MSSKMKLLCGSTNYAVLGRVGKGNRKETILAKRKNCNPVEQWIQLPLFADAEQKVHRSNTLNAQPNLPGWIGFPIRFGADANSAPQGK